MSNRRTSARRLIVIGIIMLLIGVLLISAPLLLGRGMLNKYIVTAGALGALTGASCVLHGTWDLLRERRR